MLNKKISKVGVTALLLLAVLGTLKTKSQAAQLECTKITDDKVKYVDVSMWDFNPEHYNAMMRGDRNMINKHYYLDQLKE